jgi:asparagine synthase (glutamine-hydrolysing)
MCGIVGQARNDGRQVSRPLLEQMCAGLEHRGPDKRGIFVADGTGLGIQRLRVIDLSTGDQPIANEDGSVVVVLNGEIYNYRELRDRLERSGHRFSTKGDTETIVHLYEEYGIDCVKHLHGMFAFALWDRRRRRLLVARDRLGKKPLFYAHRDGAISFASEMGALMRDQEIPADVDHAALDAYLTYGYVPAPRSALRAVRKLPPAHTLVWQDGNVTIERYWRLDYAHKLEPMPLPELCERIRDGLRAATRKRMVADVPLGAFLSGGIDSSAVVAAMAEASSRPVKTFSIGFEQEAFDELPHARRVAQQFGTDHEEFVVRPNAVEILPKLVRHYGEPFADSSAIPCFYLAELTRRHVTVALNGDGGDEAFAGYTRYVSNRMAGSLDRLPASVRRLVAAAGRRLPERGEVSSPLNRARRMAGALALDPIERYASYVSLHGADRRAALYTPEYADLVGPVDALDVLRDPWEAASGEDVLDRLLEVDTLTYLPDDLIAKIDIATMAHALEARSPFLDHEMMELAASIPASLKARGTEKKWVLREAMRGWLPDDLLDRPKQGFSVPLSDWFRGELRTHVSEVLLDPSTLARGWFREEAVRGMLDRHAAGADAEAGRIWSLLMLELWHRELVEGRASVPAPALAA